MKGAAAFLVDKNVTPIYSESIRPTWDPALLNNKLEIGKHATNQFNTQRGYAIVVDSESADAAAETAAASGVVRRLAPIESCGNNQEVLNQLATFVLPDSSSGGGGVNDENYWESLTKAPAIKIEQEDEWRWRNLCFVTDKDNAEKQACYPTLRPTEMGGRESNHKNITDYIPNPDTVSIMETRYNSLKFVETAEKFKEQLDIFSNNLFQPLGVEEFKWNHGDDAGSIIIAGGSLCNCATYDARDLPINPTPGEPPERARGVDTLVVDKMSGDIDLFLINIKGSESEQATRAKTLVEYILSWVTRKYGHNIVARSANAITILGTVPNRHVQIILRTYCSEQQVIAGFDVDSCCFSYNGERLLCNRRAYRAVICNANVADPYTASKNGTQRLIKYMNRGFGIFVPYNAVILRAKLSSPQARALFAGRVQETLTSFPFIRLLENYIARRLHVQYAGREFSVVRCANHIKTSNDYGYCLLGSSLDCGEDKMTGADWEVKSYKKQPPTIPGEQPPARRTVILRGPFEAVMSANYDRELPYTFLSNSPGNQPTGSIRPINPRDFADSLLWTFGP